METKANHVLIGAATLLMVLGTLAFALWLAKAEVDAETARYAIDFEGAVTGLGEAGDVRFNGIKVGQVKGISFHPERPDTVRVLIEVRPDTPVRADSVASLGMQGLTGVSFVQISGGSATAPRLIAEDPDAPPVIASKPSTLQALADGLPELLGRANTLLASAEELLNTDNQAEIASTLRNIEALTAMLARSESDVQRLLSGAADLTGDIGQAAQGFAATAGSVEDLAVEVRRVARTADDVLTKFDVAMKGDFIRFFDEARQLVATLDRVLQRIESDPARFFLGNAASEYQTR